MPLIRDSKGMTILDVALKSDAGTNIPFAQVVFENISNYPPFYFSRVILSTLPSANELGMHMGKFLD